MVIKTIWDISNEDFIQYVNESKTYSDLLRKCGYTNIGNSQTVKKRINLLNLSTEHFVSFILPEKKKRSLSEIFIENSTYNNNTNIKKILYKELNWEYKCKWCGINEYNNKPISLELDHINGNNKDNRIENLRLLCPNCHSQTSTFRCNNIKKSEPKKCLNCNNNLYNGNKTGYCKICFLKFKNNKIKDKPSLDILEKDLKELKTYIAVGKKYNVSDNCIRKWIRKYNQNINNKLNTLSEDISKITI